MTVQRYIYTLVLIVFIVLSNRPGTEGMMNPDGTLPSFIGYEPRRIVIKFRPSARGRINRLLTPAGRTGIPAVDELARKFGVAAIKRQFPGAKRRFFQGRTIDLSGWHKIHFETDVDIDNIVAAFKKLSDVVDVQPIGIHTVHQIPNDTSYNSDIYGKQWHLVQATDRGINSPEAWDFETGNPDIIVAVLDTGVRWFHKDLGGSEATHFEPPRRLDPISDLHGADGNMWINWDEVNGAAGTDDDGNGYLDDLIGWDFVHDAPSCWINEDCFVADNDPRDFHGHGTHVAGIVAALNNNNYGVASFAGGWGDGIMLPAGDGVKIMALRIGWTYLLNTAYGLVSMDYAAEALRYAADNGAHIVNASWGSGTLDTGGIGDAVDYYLASGGLIFKAAGNSDENVADFISQRIEDEVVSVAATGQDDCKADFSNFGDWVDVSAPGVSILSTFNLSTDPADYVATLSGTSMASPAAASAAALIWSQNPHWSAQQVRMKLLDSTDDIDVLSCNSLSYTGQLGSGRINLFAAVGSCEGDLDGNDVVDGSDLADLIDAMGCASGCPFDLTYDGNVDGGDVAVFAKDFARTNCP